MKADHLAQTLEARMRTETESTVMESRKFFSLVTARLKDDDRTLQKLEGLASRIGSDDQDRAAGKRAAELTTRLSGYVSEEIQCRLDRLYMEAMRSTSELPSSNTAGGEEEIALALEEELASLYPEITVLSEISARQQFSDPIQRELENHHGNMYSVSEKKLSQVSLFSRFLHGRPLSDRIADLGHDDRNDAVHTRYQRALTRSSVISRMSGRSYRRLQDGTRHKAPRTDLQTRVIIERLDQKFNLVAFTGF